MVIEFIIYAGSVVLFLVVYLLETAAAKGTLSNAKVDLLVLVVGTTVVALGTFALVFPDVVLGTLLMGLSVVLGGCAAGAYALFIRLVVGKTMRDFWASKDAKAQALKHETAANRQKPIQ